MPFLSDAAVGALCATGSALTWSVINLLVRSLSPAFNSVTLNALRSTVGGVLIVALPLGFFILGERVAPIALAGIILTIIGIAVLYR